MRFRAQGLALLLAALAACGDDGEIRVYTAPKEPVWRMLAAIVPAGESTWFFKLVGTQAEVEACKKDVEDFLAALKVEGNEVRWTLPAGWKQGADRADRAATLDVGGRELSITRLAGAAGGPLANVNRWRGQMGLGPVSQAGLAAESKTLAGGGLIVDLQGRRRPSMNPGPGMAAPAPRPPPPPTGEDGDMLAEVRRLLVYSTPSGWIENPRPAGPRILEFRTAGEGAPVVSLAYLQGSGGGLGPNINRWRGQVGLPEMADAEGSAQSFPFLEQPGHYVELIGAEKGLLCIFRLGPPFSLFLKLDGTREAVLREKPAFEAFARSVKVNR